MTKHITYFSGLSRKRKVAIQLVIDSMLMILCFLAAMVIRLESLQFLSNPTIWVPVAIAVGTGLLSFQYYGLYRSLVRFVTGTVLGSIGKGVAAFAMVLSISNLALAAGIPRSVPIISAALLFLAIGGLRFFVRHIFRMSLQISKKSVLIYGAGEAGVELLNSLLHGRRYAPVAFVDDNPILNGLTVGGLPVYGPDRIASLCEERGLEVVLLAMPSITHTRRRELFDFLEKLQLEVKTTPALSDIISGKSKISELRNVTPEDLLGRDPVTPNEDLLKQNTKDKVVMVTGAGGSIGSELCRQILAQNPEALILYEISEFALYSIEAELTEMAERIGAGTKIVPVLGSVQNSARLAVALKAFQVKTIYHAAAYKHVPLVEENVVEGIRNNVFGTLAIAKLAQEYNVGSFILISTDKAVRPTNIMGATKRIAELICQALSMEKTNTTYSMVRFGNVLGSSGSVIPRFRSQIEAGGPITVTHKEITRYFMTIPEASQLVIQAGAMARGGDVFVLDMGEAVRIADLAVTMVKLHGLTPYFVDDPNETCPEKGDIPICFTGLRKGEKLYEELLIGNNPEPTKHPRVMTASETPMPSEELFPALEQLLSACRAFDLPTIHKVMRALPLAYSPQAEGLSDLVWEAIQSIERSEGIEPLL